MRRQSGEVIHVGSERVDIDKLHQKAAAGNVVAQCVLGICYLDGIDVGVDYAQALRLLSAAAEHGAPRAVAALARMYSEGLGVSKNIGEAVRLYEAAASSGEFLAQIALGRIYSSGAGVPTDPAVARKWYAAAAAQDVDECDELREARDYVNESA
jgi:TPR repeat protein